MLLNNNVLSDSVGENDGVLNGPVWSDGVEGGALDFGGDDYVDVGTYFVRELPSCSS